MRRQAAEVLYMQKIASETGVPIELINSRMQNASQLLAAMTTPPPPPPAGLVEAGLDVKPLVEILKNVGDGTIDREAAIASLIQLYGISKQEAEQMIPQKRI